MTTNPDPMTRERLAAMKTRIDQSHIEPGPHLEEWIQDILIGDLPALAAAYERAVEALRAFGRIATSYKGPPHNDTDCLLARCDPAGGSDLVITLADVRAATAIVREWEGE